MAALALAACGSSSPTATSAASAGSRYQARLNLARCLRAHGLNVPDPSPNAGPAGGGGGGVFRALPQSPNFRSAMQACAKYRRDAFGLRSLSPAQRAQFQRDLVAFARCMRAHNIDVPDPTTTAGGGFRIRRQLGPGEQSPAFQNAFKACATDLPFRRGRGPGAPPGPGPVTVNPGG